MYIIEHGECVPLFLFLLPAYTEVCVCIYRRLLLGLLKSEFSASTTYPRPAPLRFDCFVLSLSLSLSLVKSFYLFFTLSPRLFPQTCPHSVSFPRPVSRWWQRASSNRGKSKGSLNQERGREREMNAE